MKSTITNHSAYYKPNNTGYLLTNILSQAGAHRSHIPLFLHLINPSLPTEQGIPLHDYRASQSLLIVYPPHIQALATSLLNIKEQQIYNNWLGSQYTPINNIKLPMQLLDMYCSITKLPIGGTFRLLLSQNSNQDCQDKLREYLNLPKRVVGEESTPLELQLIFKECEYQAPFNNEFIQISETNNIREAAVYLTSYLGYSLGTTQAISSLIEDYTLMPT